MLMFIIDIFTIIQRSILGASINRGSSRCASSSFEYCGHLTDGSLCVLFQALVITTNLRSHYKDHFISQSLVTLSVESLELV